MWVAGCCAFFPPSIFVLHAPAFLPLPALKAREAHNPIGFKLDLTRRLVGYAGCQGHPRDRSEFLMSHARELRQVAKARESWLIFRPSQNNVEQITMGHFNGRFESRTLFGWGTLSSEDSIM